MPRPTPPRLLTWPPLDPPANSPQSAEAQDSIAQMAVISGSQLTDSSVLSFLTNSRIFVAGLSDSARPTTPFV